VLRFFSHPPPRHRPQFEGAEVTDAWRSKMGGKKGEGSGVPVSGECACPSCPHRAELERIEVFYRDVFHL
jgi:hypothetical protein